MTTTQTHPSQHKKMARFPWLRPLLLFVALTLGGYLVGNVVGNVASGDSPFELPNFRNLLWLVPVSLGMLLVAFLGVLVHELGHVVGGKLVGFRFIMLVAGPLKIVRYEKHTKTELNLNAALMGGIAASLPTDDRDLRRRMMAMVAGGPLASLLLALLAGLATWLATPMFLRIAFGSTALMSLALVAVSLIPARTGGFLTDGKRLLMLRRGGPQTERWSAAAALSGALLVQRPRELNPALLAKATALADGSPDDVGAHHIAHVAALDQGEIAQAGQHLDYVMQHIAAYPEPARPGLYLEGAYFAARHRHNAALAREWLDQAGASPFEEAASRHRARAAVLLLEGSTAQGRAEAEAGLAALHKSWSQGTAAAERDWLEDVRTWQPS